MKYYFALALSASIAFTIVACSGNPAADPTPASNSTVTKAPTAAATEIPTDVLTAIPTDAPESELPSVESSKCTYAEYPRLDGSTANIPFAMSLIQYVTGCTEAEAEEKCKVSTTDYSYEALDKGKADMQCH